VSFDLSGDSGVVWSNGFEVYTLKAGERTSLGGGELVESVAAL
jgi:hypothetical protein